MFVLYSLFPVPQLTWTQCLPDLPPQDQTERGGGRVARAITKE